MVFVLKSYGEACDERVELRWKLWLGEEAALVWARLMEVMLMVGEIVSTAVWSET